MADSLPSSHARQRPLTGLALPLVGLVLALTAPALAAEPAAAPIVLPAVPPLASEPLVHFDWHGQLRTRADLLGGVRIDRDNAALTPHLGLRHGDADQQSLPLNGQMPSGDLRLRLEPAIRVGDWSTIHTQIDAWGLLGGDPALDDATDRFTASDWGQGPWRSGLAVRRAWMHAKLFGLLNVDIGRMPDHFGLGVLRNSGTGLTADAQSDVDKVLLSGELFGIRLSAARANLATWPVSRGTDAYGAILGTSSNSSETGALGLQDSADVIRYDFEASGGKFKDGKGLEWSAALLWQSQDQALQLESARDESPAAKMADPECGDECLLLTQRTLRLYWFQGALDWRTTLRGRPLRLETEGVFHYGTALRTDITDYPDAKTWVSAGAALRTTWELPSFDLKLDAGGATAETDGGFGVQDTSNFKLGGLPDGDPRSLMMGFRFHRAFQVDALLFRELIGAVANAAYVRPALRYHLLGRGDRELAVEGGVLAAVAPSANATPGKGHLLGIEPDLSLHWRQADRVQGMLRGTLLLPGSAWDNLGGVAADPAFRLEAVLRLSF